MTDPLIARLDPRIFGEIRRLGAISDDEMGVLTGAVQDALARLRPDVWVKGGDYAPEVIERVNRLTKPFELHWRHESWRPWDWKLVQVSNPALELRDEL